MACEPIVIPEKIYFKIGEVCELLDVQAHVLRYWETEFPQLAPQKNRSGQRSYRRKDVETALRIKSLLYEGLYPIAGAGKKLQQEQRENGKHKNGETAETPASDESAAPGLFDEAANPGSIASGPSNSEISPLSSQGRDALRSLSSQLLELREMLKTNQTAEASEHVRNH